MNNKLSIPQNTEAEVALLNCIIVDPNLISDLEIKEHFFYKPENRKIFLAIYRLNSEGKSVDLITIKEQLRITNSLDQAGGEIYLSSLPSNDFSPAHADSYLSLLVDAHKLRNIIELGTLCFETGYNNSVKADVATERISSAFDKLLSDDDVARTYSLANLVSEEWTNLNERIAHPEKIGIPTGFKSYDFFTGGFHPSEQLIIAARTSMGKTSLILKMMLNMAKNGVGSYIWEFEMSRSRILQRLVSIESGVSALKIKNGKLTQSEYDRVTEAMKSIENLPIYIEEDVTASLYEIMSRTRKMVNRHGIKSVIIDHIQLVPSALEEETAQLGFISREMKRLAMDTGITSVLISQLNRNLEYRTDKRPILPDLRQSGKLEEDADKVLFIYRDELYDKKESNEGLAELILAKHRDGPIGSFPVIWNGECVDFTDMPVSDK